MRDFSYYNIISNADADKPKLKLYLLGYTVLLRVLIFYIYTRLTSFWQHFHTNIFIRNYINCTMVLRLMMISKSINGFSSRIHRKNCYYIEFRRIYTYNWDLQYISRTTSFGFGNPFGSINVLFYILVSTTPGT